MLSNKGTNEVLPDEEALRQIPFWACSSLLARTARRIQPLLTLSMPNATSDYLSAVEWSFQEAERIIGIGGPPCQWPESENRELAIAHLTNFNDSIAVTYTAERIFESIHRLLNFSLGEQGYASWALRDAVTALKAFSLEFKNSISIDAFTTQVWKDYAFIKAVAEKNNWDKRSPVPQSIWSDWWFTATAPKWPTIPKQEQTFPPFNSEGMSSFKTLSPTNTLEEMGLPLTAYRYLQKGGQFDFDHRVSFVGGPVELKSADQLYIANFMHSNKESGYGSKDPNRSKSGCYQLRAVDLVLESEGYCPSGILVWFCDYKKFGCCDTDHHVARLFHRTKWSDIVESPGRYLSAQWDPLSVPAEIVYAPWDFGPYIID